MADTKLQVVIEAQDKASRVFRDFNNQLESTSKKMSAIGRNMSMKLTAPLAGLGIVAIKSSADFDTLTRAAAQMNKGTGKSLEEMKKDIRALSVETIQDTTKMAKAYYDVGSAGFKGAEGLEILKISGKAATGGLANVDAVTSTLVKTLSMFNKGGEDAGLVMDRLNGIVDTGIITFSQLASVFPTAAAQANALGISIEETGAALAVVTKKSGSAEEAATAINAVFTQLVKPTDALRDAIQEMGYENSQAAIDALGLTGVLAQLSDKVGGNVEVMGEMFGNVRAIKAVIPLLDDDVSEYNETLETINNSQGRTNELFNDMAEGPGAKMREAWIKIKIALAEFGDVMTPILVEYIDKLKFLFEKFNQLTSEQKKNIVITAALVAAIGPLLIVLGAMASGLSVVVSMLGVLLSPIGLVILAVVAFVAIGKYLIDNWEVFKEALVVIWEVIKTKINDVFEGIKEIIIDTANKVIEAWSELPENFGYLLGLIGKYIWEKWNEIKNFFTEILPGIINGIVGWFKSLPSKIAEALQNLLDIIKIKMEEIPDIIMNAVKGVKDKIIQPFQEAYDWVSNFKLPSIKMPDIGGGLSNLGSRVKSGFSSGFNDFISRPGSSPVAFSPDDTIIGMKNPAALGAGGITVNINGGTYLSESVAEDIGDMIIEKLKSQIKI